MDFLMVILASGIARTHDGDDDDDGVAQDGGQSVPANRLTEQWRIQTLS